MTSVPHFEHFKYDLRTPVPEGPPPPSFHWGEVDGVNYLTQAKNQHIPQVRSSLSLLFSALSTYTFIIIIIVINCDACSTADHVGPRLPLHLSPTGSRLPEKPPGLISILLLRFISIIMVTEVMFMLLVMMMMNMMMMMMMMMSRSVSIR